MAVCCKIKTIAAPMQFINTVESNKENSGDQMKKERGRFIHFTPTACIPNSRFEQSYLKKLQKSPRNN